MFNLYLQLYLGAIYIFKGFGKVAAEETGPNDTSGVIWAISKFFLIKNRIQLILTIIFRYISCFEWLREGG